jgi:hypothetical protein
MAYEKEDGTRVESGEWDVFVVYEFIVVSDDASSTRHTERQKILAKRLVRGSLRRWAGRTLRCPRWTR